MNILITGAASGIGKDLAKTLGYLDYKVYACCHTEKELTHKKDNKNIKYIKLNITDTNDYKNIDKYDIDILVNQAGMCVGGSFLDIDDERLEENFKVNVFSTIKLTKCFIDYCYNKKKSGKVLITSSLIDNLPIPFLGSYILTKSSLTMFSKILKKELKMANVDISVKLIKPGAYKTGFNQLMINDIEKSKYFKSNEKNHKILRSVFDLIEKKNNRTIVNKMVKAIKCDSNKFVYVAPLSQRLTVKLYKIISSLLEK